MKQKYIALVGILYFVASAFAVWGYLAGAHHFFPYSLIKSAKADVVAFFRGGDGEEGKSMVERMTLPPLVHPNPHGVSGFVLRDKGFHDPGYLLIPRYSGTHGQMIIELFRIADGKVLHQWIPPLDKILGVEGFPEVFKSADRFTSEHPVLLDDGSIVFCCPDGPLVRLDKESKVVWINSKARFHHSVELGVDGNLYVSIFSNQWDASFAPPKNLVLEDGFAVVSKDGKILREYSTRKMLMTYGDYRSLWFGSIVGNTLSNDPFHINDAHPLSLDSPGVVDAVGLSLRHLSVVAIFSLKDGSMRFLRRGPWLNQHDVSPTPDGRYSVFDNNVIRVMRRDGSVHRVRDESYSTVRIWDPTTGEVESPYDDIFKRIGMRADAGGRGRVLPNGDAVVEESTRSRVIRVSRDKVRWEYVAPYGDDDSLRANIQWSRYLMPSEIDLSWLE